MSADRQVVQDALAAGLLGAVTAAQAVYAYQPEQIEPQSPVVTVLAAGGEWPPLTTRGVFTHFFFEVNTFVVRVAKNQTPQTAEQQLNAVTKQIADYVEANFGKGAAWTSLQFAERSQIIKFTDLGGTVYWREMFLIQANV